MTVTILKRLSSQACEMKAVLYGVGGRIARAAATILSIRDFPGRDRLSDEREGRNERKRERSGVKRFEMVMAR